MTMKNKNLIILFVTLQNILNYKTFIPLAKKKKNMQT